MDDKVSTEQPGRLYLGANWAVCTAAILFIIALVVWNSIHYGLIDIIGRNIRVLIMRLSAGKPIYFDGTESAISMSYLPGYLFIGAAWDNLFAINGSSSWRSFYVFATLVAVMGYVVSCCRLVPRFAWVFPVAILACPYPLLWPRGDLPALSLTTLGGMLLVTNRHGNPSSFQQNILPATMIGLGLLTKQTYLPYVLFFVIYAARGNVMGVQFRNIMRQVCAIAAAVVIPMLVFTLVYGEQPAAILSVLTWGKSHEIRSDILLGYGAASLPFVLLATAALCFHGWKTDQRQFSRVEALLAGAAYWLLYAGGLAFSAKVGSSWHHLLMLVLPTVLLIDCLKPKRQFLLFFVFAITFLALAGYGFWNGLWPVRGKPDFRPAPIGYVSGSESVLVYDSSDRYFHIEEIPRALAVDLPWERGALEELTVSGAIPGGFLADISAKRWEQILFPEEIIPFPNVSMYGTPYEEARALLEQHYIASGIQDGWHVYVRRDDQ